MMSRCSPGMPCGNQQLFGLRDSMPPVVVFQTCLWFTSPFFGFLNVEWITPVTCAFRLHRPSRTCHILGGQLLTSRRWNKLLIPIGIFLYTNFSQNMGCQKESNMSKLNLDKTRLLVEQTSCGQPWGHLYPLRSKPAWSWILWATMGGQHWQPSRTYGLDGYKSFRSENKTHRLILIVMYTNYTMFSKLRSYIVQREPMVSRVFGG